MGNGGLGTSGVVPTIRSGGRRFLDPYRRDDYKQDGTLEFPFKTVNLAVANIPAPSAEDIDLMLSDPTASKEGICELSLYPGYYGDIEVDRPCVISGSIGSYVSAGDIVIGGLIGMVVLRNITANSLTVTSAGIVVLIECNITNITTENGAGYLMLSATDVAEALTFVGQHLLLSRESSVTDLDLTADGENLTVIVKNSTISGDLTTTQTDAETITWVLMHSWITSTYEAADYDSITNINSVFPNLDQAAANNYTLLAAGPAEA